MAVRPVKYCNSSNEVICCSSLNTVPKRLKGFLLNNELSEDDIVHICREMPESLYRR